MSDPSALERESAAYRRCFAAGMALLLAALAGQELSTRTSVAADACPHARVASVDSLAQPRAEPFLLQIGEAVGRALVSELRGD